MAEQQSTVADSKRGKEATNTRELPHETINPGDVERKVGEKQLNTPTPKFYASEVTYREIVFYLAVGILIIILIIVLGLGCYLFTHAPLRIDYSQNPMELTADQMVEVYKELSDIVIGGVKELFDSSVARTFVPILATIIGYILGTHYGDRAERDKIPSNNPGRHNRETAR